MWVGLIQSVEGLKRTERPIFSESEGILEQTPPDWNGDTGSSPSLRLPVRPEDVGLTSRPNYMNQFLRINLCLYVHIISILFHWRTPD